MAIQKPILGKPKALRSRICIDIVLASLLFPAVLIQCLRSVSSDADVWHFGDSAIVLLDELVCQMR